MSKLQDTLDIEKPLRPYGAKETQESIDDDYKNLQSEAVASRKTQELTWGNYERYRP
jgi:hypothetical protein